MYVLVDTGIIWIIVVFGFRMNLYAIIHVSIQCTQYVRKYKYAKNNSYSTVVTKIGYYSEFLLQIALFNWIYYSTVFIVFDTFGI